MNTRYSTYRLESRLPPRIEHPIPGRVLWRAVPPDDDSGADLDDFVIVRPEVIKQSPDKQTLTSRDKPDKAKRQSTTHVEENLPCWAVQSNAGGEDERESRGAGET